MELIKIVIAGPRGRMGREAVQLVNNTDNFQLVGVIDRINNGKKLSEVEGFQGLNVPIYSDIEQAFSELQVDVLIDLTTPELGRIHTQKALEFGVRPVVGTTGFTEDDLQALGKMAQERGLGVIIAPNFAIGAVLMMKFAKMAAKYFQDIEIIELHHDKKLDAPSGTALKTAHLMSEVRDYKQQGHPNEKETIHGVRGGEFNGIHIHSVRLPGLVAHQEVLFGGDGQSLTIRHDSFNRASFMSGVKLAVETVMNLDVLVYGLENIIE